MSRFKERFAWYPVRVYKKCPVGGANPIGRILFVRWGWWERLKAVNNYNHGWIHFELKETPDAP